MGKETRYLIVKKKDQKDIVYMEYDKMKGFPLTPKPGLSFQDSIQVNKMIVLKPSFIETIVHKKVDKQWKQLLTLLTILFETDDETGTAIREALNEIEKFRLEIKNKYRDYLTKEELKLMAKKLSILQEEAKQRLFALEYHTVQEKSGKSR